MNKRLLAIIVLVLGVALGYAALPELGLPGPESGRFGPFKLGLDLSGGTELVYRADTSVVASDDETEAMEGLRDVIERRVNLFGVAEPLVQTERISFGLDTPERRLIVQLPGVTNVEQAVAMIGATPVLEFKTERPADDRDRLLAQYEPLLERQRAGEDVFAELSALDDPYYVDSELTGRFLSSARVDFRSLGGHGGVGPGSVEPVVLLEFNDEGTELFADMTSNNVGKPIAIYLDGQPISQPIVNVPILDGSAEISGGFEADEARQLARRLNSGALPVPIELVSTTKVGAVLGGEAAERGVKAGMWGLILVAIFLIAYYRLSGVLAVVALAIYVFIMLALFKLIPVTLTSAGIAGFVLSIGMAVDANVLIFERMREEKRRGSVGKAAIDSGFKRAWASIRDGNISSILTAIVLFWFGTSLVQGFALTFGLGVIVSMFSAVVITRSFLLATAPKE